MNNEMVKNELARLFTIRVSEHFCTTNIMTKEEFFKYMKEVNDEYRRRKRK